MIDIHEGFDFTHPRCPHCDTPLKYGGKVVDENGVKKWVGEWSCRAHGRIESLRHSEKPTPSSVNDKAI